MFWNLVLAQPVVGAIIKVGGEALRQAVGLAIVPYAIDNVETGPPLAEHIAERLGWVLQVDVHRHHGRAARMVNPGGQRRFLAEVAR
jgi:hypothetical protein